MLIIVVHKRQGQGADVAKKTCPLFDHASRAHSTRPSPRSRRTRQLTSVRPILRNRGDIT